MRLPILPAISAAAKDLRKIFLFPLEDLLPGFFIDPVVYADHGGDVFAICVVVALAGHGVQHLLRGGVFPIFAARVHGDGRHFTGCR